MFPPVDTKNFAAVAAFVRQKFAEHYPKRSSAFVDRVLQDVNTLFTGNHADYAAIDLRYHDFEHTLQATVCLTLLFEGYIQAKASPRLSARQFELGLAAVLLHDSGYLKLRSDLNGTGAKYTFCHVLRSCAFAATYLPTIGCTEAEVSGVLSAINCTGPTNEISRLQFRGATERFVGCALATADYLGQLAAEDYPDELEILFNEFCESDEFTHMPPELRVFKSAEDLVIRTPNFWRKFVKPKLENDFQNVFRFLARPYPDGENAYLTAIHRNIEVIEQRAADLVCKPV